MVEKHERGVNFVIKNNIRANLVRFKPINDRICYVKLKGKKPSMEEVEIGLQILKNRKTHRTDNIIGTRMP